MNFLNDDSVTRWLKNKFVTQFLEKVAKTVAEPKKCQNINIEAQLKAQNINIEPLLKP